MWGHRLRLILLQWGEEKTHFAWSELKFKLEYLQRKVSKTSNKKPHNTEITLTAWQEQTSLKLRLNESSQQPENVKSLLKALKHVTLKSVTLTICPMFINSFYFEYGILEVRGPSEPQLLVDGPWGRLDFVLRALRALRPRLTHQTCLTHRAAEILSRTNEPTNGQGDSRSRIGH